MMPTTSRVGLIWRLSAAALVCALVALGCSGGDSPLSPGVESMSAGSDSSESLLTASDQTSTNGPPGLAGRSHEAKYVENEVMVVLDPSVQQQALQGILAGWPLRVIKAIPCRWAKVYRLEITDGTPVEEMVDRLRDDPNVKIAEPNYIYHFFEDPYRPNDPLWERDDPGTDPRDCIYDQWGPAKIGASIVWNETKGSEDVIVAIIDTGIRRTHEDIETNVWINEDEIPDNEEDDDENGWVDDWWGWDAAYDDNDPWDEGWYGSYHGTACSGVTAAAQDNEVGVTGIAPGVKVMALRIDFQDDIYESAVIESLEYARVNGAAICSMSFGGPSYSEVVDAACHDVWDEGNGVILIASAGNYDTTEVFYPANYDPVLCIGATVPFSHDGVPYDEQRIKSWDELGYYWGSNYGGWVDVMAFGERYTTLDGVADDTYLDGTDDAFFGGTSNASPMVAAVMALIRSYFPAETSQWCRDRLVDTVDDLDEPGFDIQTANGRINALRAIYGSDRYADQEDALGFVPLTLPDTQVFDCIHDVPDNPYHDTEDLYRVTALEEGSLVAELDIFTWGEDLDIAIYRDEEMTELADESTGPNHAGSSTESVLVSTLPGEEYFLKVMSPEGGNSTIYGLRVFNTTNALTITGENIAPVFIHQQGEDIPFLKLTLEVGFQAKLDELIINKYGDLPNHKWTMARLFRDANSNGVLDKNDELAIEKFPQARNRLRLDGLDIEWDYHEPLVLFFTADIGETLGDAVVRFGLQSYKDATTKEGSEAHYTQFPVLSDWVPIGTDADPPEWVDTVGAQTAEAYYLSARIGWNEAVDELTPPVKYNVYYTDTLPFDIDNAKKVTDIPFEVGTTTDYVGLVSGLEAEVEQHFVVRAEDQAGNEEENLVIVSCIPMAGGDPTKPELLRTYDLYYPFDVAVKGDVLVVADTYDGVKIFDRSDPVELELVGHWEDDWGILSVEYDGTYAYCGGWDYFSVVDLTTPSDPQTTDQVTFWDASGMKVENGWAYAANDYAELAAIDVSDPYNISISSTAMIPSGGYPYDLALAGDYIYAADYLVGILALNRSDPGHPYYLNTFDWSSAVGLQASESVLYAMRWSGGYFLSYDLEADPASPPMLDQTTDGPGTQGYHALIHGDYAYVTRHDYGLVVFDISDPADLQHVGSLPLEGASALASDDVFIYVLTTDDSYNGWLHVVI